MAKPLEQEQTIETNESIYGSISSFDSLRSHETLQKAESEPETKTEGHDTASQGSHETIQKAESEPVTKTAEPVTQVSKWYRLAVFGLGFTSVLLLAAVGVFWFNFNKLSEETEQLQTRSNELMLSIDEASFDKLNLSRDELQKNLLVTKKIMNYPGWIYFAPSLYYISNERKTWSKSRKECIEKGVDLVIINTAEEKEFIYNWSRSMEVWIGLSKDHTDGKLRWVDGTEVTIAFWKPGEPSNREDYDCVAKVLDSDTSWSDFPCDAEFFYICEWTILS